MRIFAVFVAAVSLSGCAGSPVGDAIAGPEKLAQQDDAYCRSIGLRHGSPDYAGCRMVQTQQRETKHAAAVSSAAGGIRAAGDAASRPAPRMAPSTRTTCSRNGNQVECLSE